MVQHLDNGFLDAVNEITNTHTTAVDVHQGINDNLAGAVIGHLPTPIDLDDRDITGRQHVLGLSGLPLGEYRRMLYQPEFINGILTPLVGKILHGMPDSHVVGKPELSNKETLRCCIA